MGNWTAGLSYLFSMAFRITVSGCVFHIRNHLADTIDRLPHQSKEETTRCMAYLQWYLGGGSPNTKLANGWWDEK